MSHAALREELAVLDRRRKMILFWLKVETLSSGCWEWTGHINNGGYGRVKNGYAHRLAYEMFVGPIPDGADLDHLCRRRSCVNPAHLEPVTRAENLSRGEGISSRNAQKTHCPKGHEYSVENTYIQMKRGRPSRSCLICRQERDR